jgi:hypothetical protein
LVKSQEAGIRASRDDRQDAWRRSIPRFAEGDLTLGEEFDAWPELRLDDSMTWITG